jgi:hypothetical protein
MRPVIDLEVRNITLVIPDVKPPEYFTMVTDNAELLGFFPELRH